MDVIFDIDGTLANAKHRLHLIMSHGPKDWERFLSEDLVMQDEPIYPIWRCLGNHIITGDKVVFITGRNETQRAMTTEWLLDAAEVTLGSGVLKADDIKLYMRTAGDRRESHIVKEESLQRAITYERLVPFLVYEDRKSDCDMWRRNDLICCHVAEGLF